MTSAWKNSDNQVCVIVNEQMPAQACEFQPLLSGLKGILATVLGVGEIQELIVIDSHTWPYQTAAEYLFHQHNTETSTWTFSCVGHRKVLPVGGLHRK